MLMNENVNIHPTAEVQPGAMIGAGTIIWQNCIVLSGATIGEDCLLSANVYLEGKVVVGNRVKIKNNVAIYDWVTLEDDVFVGPSAVFTNVLTPRAHWPSKDELLPTLIRQGASIGANCTVVCGSKVGRYAMIGASSVVTHDIPDFALAYGSPALQRGWVCHCGNVIGQLNSSQYTCPVCGSSYYLDQGMLKERQLVFYRP